MGHEGGEGLKLWGDPVRALTLWQPWASLIAIDAKRIETRSWETKYRGWLLIHAASRFQVEERNLAYNREPFRTVLGSAGLLPAGERPATHVVRMPLGAVVAVARLQDCIRCDEDPERLAEHGAAHEFSFGGYTPGRYAWLLSEVRPLPESIPASGGQRLWRPSAELVAAVSGSARNVTPRKV